MKEPTISKEHKKARDNLEKFSRAIIMQYSFGKIKTFYDLLKVAGYSDEAIKQKYFPSEYNKTITRQEVLEYLSDRRIELTTQQYLETHPLVIIYDEPIKNDSGVIQTSSSQNEISKETTADNTSNKLAILDHPADTIVDKAIATPDKYVGTPAKTEEEPKPKEKFVTSPNESSDIFFFWFQKDAIMKMLNGILKGE